MEILPAQPAGSPVAPAAPTGSNLRLTITESTNPARVGERLVVYLNVQNNGQQVERQVSVRMLLPPELSADAAQIQPQSEASVRGQEIRFSPIAEVQPKAERQYVIPVNVNQVGQVKIRAELAAPSLAAPLVLDSNSIEILPR